MKRALQLKMVDPRKHSEAKLARMADIVRERVRRERREAAEAEKKAAEEEKRAKAMPHVNGIAKVDESGPPLVVKTESGLVVKTESAGSSGAPATPAPHLCSCWVLRTVPTFLIRRSCAPDALRSWCT